MKSSALPATLFCTALMLAPLCGGAGSAKATTAIAQQTGILKGTVVDANGEAVIGASVIIEGQKVTQGTVTDFDGNFSLNVKPGAKLKISYIGFVSQTVVAKNGDKVKKGDLLMEFDVEAIKAEGNRYRCPLQREE